MVRLHKQEVQKHIKLAYEIKQYRHREQLTIVPVFLSATDVTPNTLHKSLQLLNLTEVISNNIQRAAVLATWHTVRKILSLQL